MYHGKSQLPLHVIEQFVKVIDPSLIVSAIALESLAPIHDSNAVQ